MTRIALTAVGLIVALLLTLAVFGVDPIAGSKLILEGAFGDKAGLARTLVRTSPLLLCGLGMAMAWRSGMYNVGGEGQYLVGGLLGAFVARPFLSHPSPVGTACVLIAAVLAGATVAAFAAWLQVKRGVQCVISTILMNFVIVQLLAWAVRGPIQESKHQLPLSDRLPSGFGFSRFDPQTDLHSGLVLTLIVFLLIALLLPMTRFGFLVKVVGHNPNVLRANRHDPSRVQIQAMAVSGALCGLAGAIDYLGLIGQIGDGFSQNWGFLAIPVALLGGLNAWGVLGAALYFGALMAGGESLSRFNATGTTLVYVIQAVAVLGLLLVSQRRKPQVTVSD